MPSTDNQGGSQLFDAARGGVLTIDLDALAANYRSLAGRAAPAMCGAAVKADAYGLGMGRVAPVLWRAGCRVFFVATLDEGVTLRALLDEAEIHVLNGLMAGCEDVFLENRLVPTLNDLGQIEAWSAFASGTDGGGPLPASVHMDTGINRLGLAPEEAEILAGAPGRLDGLDLRYIISHLACADDPDNGMNARQLGAFNAVRARLPHARASLANSGGIFLGSDYHLDLVRPGIAIYGGNPHLSGINPMAQVIHLQGKILQVRRVDSPMTVGYGATHAVAGPARIATVGVGYADGYLRAFSNRGFGYIGGKKIPLVGRVSMDLVTFDVTSVPENEAVPGAFVDLIGGAVALDDAAAAAGSISYELLTGLGSRYARVYAGNSD